MELTRLMFDRVNNNRIYDSSTPTKTHNKYYNNYK